MTMGRSKPITEKIPDEKPKPTCHLLAITAWKFFVPFPSALDNRVERFELGLPAKFLLNSRRGCDEPGRVAWPAWFFDRLDFSSGDFAA